MVATTVWSAIAEEANAPRVVEGVPPEMARIPEGSFRPLFGADGQSSIVKVDSFLMDRLPVTNAR